MILTLILRPTSSARRAASSSSVSSLAPRRKLVSCDSGTKPRGPHVDQHAALVVLEDGGVDDFALLEELLGGAPHLLLLGAAEGEHGAAVALRLHDVDQHGLAKRIGRARLLEPGVPLLALGHEALGLEADVHENLVGLDADDHALEHVAAADARQLRTFLVQQGFHGLERRRLVRHHGLRDGAGGRRLVGLWSSAHLYYFGFEEKSSGTRV